MTVTEQVENLSRNLEGLRSGEQVTAREEIIRKLSEIFRNLRGLTESSSDLFEAASVLAPQLESAELAVEVWEDIHKNFALVLSVLEGVPKAEPEIDNLIQESRAVFGEFVQKSSKALLDWDAQAEVARCEAIAREGFAMLDEEALATIPSLLT
jgi:uncharacterized coiled-coil DUF342 family protein